MSALPYRSTAGLQADFFAYFQNHTAAWEVRPLLRGVFVVGYLCSRRYTALLHRLCTQT